MQEEDGMVRFGLIGTNFISHTFMEAAKDVPDFELAAVYSRSEETGREFASKYGTEKVYTSLEDLAGDPSIDAVYVASPNSFHAPQSILMMEHGKHVLCEKPVATDCEEWETMLDSAKKNKVILLEAMRMAFDPVTEKIKELLPQLGTIRRVTFEFSQYSSRYDKFKEGIIMNAFNPAFSNAALMDIGVYCVHPMVMLFGKPESIFAKSIFLSNGMEGMGTVVAGYSEMQAILQYSKISASYAPCQIQGEKGSLIFNQISQVKELELYLGKESREHIKIDKKENNMYYEIDRFVKMILSGQKGREEAEEFNLYTAMEMQVMDEIRKQAGITFSIS